MLLKALGLNVNFSLFAYGQTGSGKTFALSGGPWKKDGAIPRTVMYIAENGHALGYIRVMIKCWMVQVYKSDLVDLLRPAGKIRIPLRVAMDKNGPQVVGATQLRFVF